MQNRKNDGPNSKTESTCSNNMNSALKIISDEIRGSDICSARSATVRATLVLEHDARGHWDSAMTAGFPQSSLYDQVFTDADIADFIHELASLSQDDSVPHELMNSTISACSPETSS